MSVSRENVIWQSEDGTWNRGFYSYEVIGEDHEWDVIYDDWRFHWVRTGMKTLREAEDCWRGANPGGYDLYPYHPSSVTIRCEFDRMALQAKVRPIR